MHGDRLEQFREPTIWFRRQIGSETTTSSKLGGLPTLPPGTAWPRQLEAGTPLHFLAQIDLSRLPSTPLDAAGPTLPKRGMLFFFADMVEEMLWGDNGGPFATPRVIFADQGGPERSAPDDIPEILHGFGQHAGGYNTGLSVYPHAVLEPHVIDTFGGGISPFIPDAYSIAAQAALVASIEKAIGPLPVFSGQGSWNAIKAANPREYIHDLQFRDGSTRRELHCPLHQMLGIGKPCQGTSDDAYAEGRILLLQIDSDTLVHEHFMFCDMGIAQFWITPADLAARRFDKAWATTEGG